MVPGEARLHSRGGLGVQADDLQPGVLTAVVGQDHRASCVDTALQQRPRGRHPVRLTEEVNGQVDRVDAQIHEGAAAQSRIEGRRQTAGAVELHPRGELLLGQHHPVQPPQPRQVLT